MNEQSNMMPDRASKKTEQKKSNKKKRSVHARLENVRKLNDSHTQILMPTIYMIYALDKIAIIEFCFFFAFQASGST